MIAHVMRQNLRKIVAAYKSATGLSTPQVSKRFYGNADFLDAFFSGDQSVSLNKLDSVLTRLAAEWPQGAEWPYCRAVIIKSPRRRR